LNPGDDSYARGVNNAAIVVGDSGPHAFVFDSLTWSLSALPSLPPPEANLSFAYTNANDINDSNVIVGSQLWYNTKEDSYRRSAIRWVGGVPELLSPGDSRESYARAVNASGVIVGDLTLPSYEWRGFVYYPSDGFYDINTLVTSSGGMIMVQAADVNALGNITGVCASGTGYRACLAVKD
jgi:uncharacterized membrane protein